jgi:hypothetical protein
MGKERTPRIAAVVSALSFVLLILRVAMNARASRTVSAGHYAPALLVLASVLEY